MRVTAAALALILTLGSSARAEPITGDDTTAAGAPEDAAKTAGSEDESSSSSRSRLYSALGLTGFYLGLGGWAYFAWYYNVDTLPEFEVGGDGWFERDTYAGGADKLGHFWANYVATRVTAQMLEAGGWNTLPATLISGGLAWTFFAFVEIKDGYYYQLSPGDTVFNTIGVGLGILMENVPALDRLLDFTVVYFPSEQYRHDLVEDGDIDIAEDYSGQTYLVRLHLSEVPAITGPRWMRWAKFVDVAAGFETRGYRPVPDDNVTKRRQGLFIGFSLNLQHALAEIFETKSLARRIGHGVFEYYTPPYTTLRVSDAERISSPRMFAGE